MSIIQDTIEGVTTAAYSGNTLKFNCKHREFKSISVVNGDAALELTYYITGYFDANEKAFKVLKTATDLAATEVYNLMVNTNQYDHITVFIKSKTLPIKYYVIQNFR